MYSTAWQAQMNCVSFWTSSTYAIVEQVACDKYLNSLQIFEYITLRGYDIDRPKLRKRILKLMKYRVIQESEMVSTGAEHGLKYYENNISDCMEVVE